MCVRVCVVLLGEERDITKSFEIVFFNLHKQKRNTRNKQWVYKGILWNPFSDDLIQKCVFAAWEASDRGLEERGRENEDSLPEFYFFYYVQVGMCLWVFVCVSGFRRLPLISRQRLYSHLLPIFSQTLRNLSPPHFWLSLSLSCCQVFNNLFFPQPSPICFLSSTFILIYFSPLHWVLGHRFLSHRDMLFLFL